MLSELYVLWKINKTDKWVKEGHGEWGDFFLIFFFCEWGFVEYLFLRRVRGSRSKGILLMKTLKILTDNLSENIYGLEERTLFLVKQQQQQTNKF